MTQEQREEAKMLLSGMNPETLELFREYLLEQAQPETEPFPIFSRQDLIEYMRLMRENQATWKSILMEQKELNRTIKMIAGRIK